MKWWWYLIKVLNQVKYRVEWQRHQDREKRKEEEAIERERGRPFLSSHTHIYIYKVLNQLTLTCWKFNFCYLDSIHGKHNFNHLMTLISTVAYAQIDWHDFVVVETVDFQPNESGKCCEWASTYSHYRSKQPLPISLQSLNLKSFTGNLWYLNMRERI